MQGRWELAAPHTPRGPVTLVALVQTNAGSHHDTADTNVRVLRLSHSQLLHVPWTALIADDGFGAMVRRDASPGPGLPQ